MSELGTRVTELVHAATRDVDPKAIKGTVEAMLVAFDDAKKKDRDEAVTALGKALGKARGRGAQILCLALGAVVESGASPELAFPAIAKGLPDLLERAESFAKAALKKAKTTDLEAALTATGAALAKKSPADADAWKELAPRCLAAVACLVRSREARAKATKNDKLLDAAEHLANLVPEVSLLSQAARILDGAELVILAPAIGRGWKATISEIPSNSELYVLVAAAIVGKGKWPGKAPSAKIVKAVAESALPNVDLDYAAPFHLATPEGAVDGEGVPAELPRVGKTRVVLVQEPALEEPLAVVPPFDALRPKLVVTGELSSTEIAKLVKKLGQ